MFDNLDFTVGVYRALVSLLYLKDYELYIPRNTKYIQIENTKKLLEEEIKDKIIEILKSANVLPPIPKKKMLKIFYYKKLSKIFSEPIYYPGENFLFREYYFNEKLQLMQLLPGVGSYIYEKNSKFYNLLQNVKLNDFLINRSNKLLVKYLYNLIKLKVFNNGIYLSVSKSHPYEFKRLGIKSKIFTIDPENGIFHKELDNSKDYDLIYIGRATPDKGFLDLIYILQYLDKNINKKIKIIVIVRDRTELLDKLLNTKFRNIEIIYLSKIPREKLRELLAKTKIFIFPSKVEGLSLSYLRSSR